jgi:DNA polymerase-3 subunit chi
VREASPVVLGGALDALAHQDVLLNLDAEVPTGFERFTRVIEVVGADDEERAHSRARWKYYQQRGYPIVRHDLADKGGR